MTLSKPDSPTVRRLLLILLLFWGGASLAGSAPAEGLVAPSAFRALVGNDTWVTAAVQRLGPVRSAALYRTVSYWSDRDTDLTGTLGQASDAVAWLVRDPDFGADALHQVVSRLGPDSSQAFLIGLAGTASGSQTWSRRRAKDALAALMAPVPDTPLDDLVRRGLVNLDGLHELNGLRVLDLGSLPLKKRLAIRAARLSAPSPNPGQRLQKVIKLKDLTKYLSGEYQPTVGGSVAFYDQVAFLRTPAELIAGLRLDYPGGFAGETRVGALVFPRPPEMRLRIPFDPLLGGAPTPELVYPFTGTGFTASTRGRLIPEMTLASSVRQPLPEGAQCFEIDETGHRHLRATLGPEGRWLLTQKAGPLAGPMSK
jgi:hypothetical protein